MEEASWRRREPQHAIAQTNLGIAPIVSSQNMPMIIHHDQTWGPSALLTRDTTHADSLYMYTYIYICVHNGSCDLLLQLAIICISLKDLGRKYVTMVTKRAWLLPRSFELTCRMFTDETLLKPIWEPAYTQDHHHQMTQA